MANRNELLNDEQEALRVAMDGRLSSVWTTLPALVVSVNWDAMTCEVQPAIQGIIEDENGVTKNVNLPMLVDVPITFPSAGGFILTLPLKAGDEVLVCIAARCIDSWWQSGEIGIPVESRMHDLSDGFAIPGPRSQKTKISNISETAAQLRNDEGDTYLEISADGKIKLVATTEVIVEAPLVSVDSADIQLKGNTTVTGNLTVTGNVVAPNVTGTVGVVSAGKPFNTHVHSGVDTGPSNTGVPV